MKENRQKGVITEEYEEKLKKAIYYCIKFALDGVFPQDDSTFNPISELLKRLILLSNEEKSLLKSIEKDCFR